MSSDDELYGPSTSGVPDEELTLPRAVMNKMIREKIQNCRVSTETRDLIMQSATEFIHLLSTEANEICEGQQKRTISPEHALMALEKLGYEDYVKEAETVLTDYSNAVAKKRRKSKRLENLGIPEEELLRQQQALFAQAREQQLRQEQEEAANAAANALANPIMSTTSNHPQELIENNRPYYRNI